MECYTLTVEAFNLSEQYRTPVIILSDALIGHMREAVVVPEPGALRIAERGEPDCAPDEYDTVSSTLDNILPRPPLGSPFKVHVTGLVYNRRSGMPDTADPAAAADLGRYLREKIYHHRDAIVRVEESAMEDAEIAIFAYGSVARSAKAVVKWARAQGVPVGMVRPITLWPFPTAAVDRMAEQVRAVIVPEMNIKQMSWEVQAAVAGRAKVVDHGRIDGKLITPAEIKELVKAEFPYHRWEEA
jgi:2-oxoglutarate ferredoxin oxidoreductase subunit alpha